ncbi:MAG: FHA domain-containing protein [Paludibacteraceae bacterium]|nr:FHA domain-containing protein [Paludibacteraceae bacterium]
MKTIIVGRGRSVATQRIEILDSTVSREHCWLTDNGDGTYTLLNKSTQGTFVNGIQVVKTTVTPNTYIKLSNTTTVKVADLLPLDVVQSVPQSNSNPTPEFSIKELQIVWKKYEDAKRELGHKQHNIGLLFRVPFIFTALSAILSAIIPDDYRIFTIVLTVISSLITVYGYMQQKSFVYQDEMNKLNEKMIDDYICTNPQCRRHLGIQNYKILRQNTKCPYCGCKWTTK